MANCNTNLAKSVRHLDKDAWLEGIDFLLSMNLQSLQVRCPKCHCVGTPGPKWEKGPKVKPLYVFHKDGQSVPKTCALDQSDAEQVRGQVILAEEDIATLIRNANTYVLFSGGRDSLCTLDYLMGVASSIGREITALHVDTTAGFPEVTTYVEKTCQKMKVDLKILTPETDYFTLAKEWGIPAFNSRWCCRELKIKPLADFLAKISNPKIVFDGIRAVESSIRAKYLPVWFHPGFNCLSVSPIFHWSDEEIQAYIEKRNLPTGPSFELGTSAECWCGAYKRKADFEELYRLHPEIYDKLIEVEQANKYGFTFIYENGKKIPLANLKSQIEDSGDIIG